MLHPHLARLALTLRSLNLTSRSICLNQFKSRGRSRGEDTTSKLKSTTKCKKNLIKRIWRSEIDTTIRSERHLSAPKILNNSKIWHRLSTEGVSKVKLEMSLSGSLTA